MLERLWGSEDAPAAGEKQTLCSFPEKDNPEQGQSLGKSWSELPWSMFVGTGERREQLGAASMG